MRILFFAGALLVGNAAFGIDLSKSELGTYRGRGHYQTIEGKDAKYKVETTFEKVEGRSPEEASGIAMTNAYEFDEEKKEKITVVATPQKNGFFSLTVEGDVVIGDGHCFKSQCQLAFEYQGMKVRETLIVSRGSVLKIGTFVTDTGEKIAYREALRKARRRL